MIYRTIIFLFINFAALGLGSWLMARGPVSDWYIGLNKAPWTPPGWAFGAAWTIIMITFAFYMSHAYELANNKQILLGIFILQWILNVGWNPVFFRYHYTLWGLVVILALTFVVAYLFFNYLPAMKWKSLFILPYLLWLLVASSLNAYIYLKN